MQVFAVTVERTARRKLRVLAATQPAAIAMVAATLGPGATATEAVPVRDETLLPAPDLQTGLDALDHLLRCDFLPINGRPSNVLSWIESVSIDATREKAANKALAMAGMRLLFGPEDGDGRLAIGSALSIPLLGHWCNGTPFAGAALLPALATLPGAERPRSGLTFSGIASRVVTVPLSVALGE